MGSLPSPPRILTPGKTDLRYCQLLQSSDRQLLRAYLLVPIWFMPLSTPAGAFRHRSPANRHRAVSHPAYQAVISATGDAFLS